MDKDILKGLADNPLLFQAVKQVVLKRFEFDYSVQPEVPNEELGAATRAILEGRKRIEEAFSEISHYKSVKETPDKPMPAR